MDEMTIERLHCPDGQGREELRVSGSLTIAAAADFRATLLVSLEEACDLELDLTGVTEMDLTGLQLICAAHGSAEEAGKVFRVKEGDNGVLRRVAAEAGFQRQAGCHRDNSSSCIWVKGVN